MNPTIKKHLKIFGYVLLLMLVSRALLYLTGYLGVNLFSDYTIKPAYDVVNEFGQNHDLMRLPAMLKDTEVIKLGHLLKFDTYFYLRIADTGYDRFSIYEPHGPANWVFMPLYPLSTAVFAKLFPFLGLLGAGVLLSNLYLAFALTFIYLIGLERGLDERGTRTVLFLLLIYPASLYFSIFYTESLFLLLSAMTVYFSLRKNFAVAFLAAGLSTVTRVPGVANLIFVGGSLLLYKGFRYRLSDLKYLLYAALSVIPLLAYFYYLKGLTGDFLAAIHEQTNWWRGKSLPFQAFFSYPKHPYFTGEGGWDNGFISFTVSAVVFLALLVYLIVHAKSMLRKPAELLFFIYGGILIIIPFSSSSMYLTSVVRYMMVSIPVFFYLQDLASRHDLIKKFAVGFFLVLNTIITICFINNYYFVV